MDREAFVFHVKMRRGRTTKEWPGLIIVCAVQLLSKSTSLCAIVSSALMTIVSFYFDTYKLKSSPPDALDYSLDWK